MQNKADQVWLIPKIQRSGCKRSFQLVAVVINLKTDKKRVPIALEKDNSSANNIKEAPRKNELNFGTVPLLLEPEKLCFDFIRDWS